MNQRAGYAVESLPMEGREQVRDRPWQDGRRTVMRKVKDGLGDWLRGWAEGFKRNPEVAPARTRSRGGTPPIPPTPRSVPPPPTIDEPRLRRLVADALGVEIHELTPDVSLVDELAADSLDLLEVALLAEDEFGIRLDEHRLESVRTYGELMREVDRTMRRRVPRELPQEVWSRVVPSTSGAGVVERAGTLTPYLAETIAEDAARAGRGARVELTVPAHTGLDGLAALEARFATLPARGVDVWLRRRGGPSTVVRAPDPNATASARS